MLDIKFIRENPDVIKDAVKKRGMHFDVDFLLESDERRRAFIAERNNVRAGHNAISEEISIFPSFSKIVRFFFTGRLLIKF